MNDGPAPCPPASTGPGGLLGVLRTWLRAWSTEEAPEVPAPAPAQDSGRPLRVLVADDDPFNRTLAAARLRALGLEAVLAADGAEAVALACELHFDLVLMDLQMPVLDGLRATLAIRRFESLSQRPAVPVVAHSSASPAAPILESHGLNGSLRKPCGEAEFEACLRRWCPRYRALPAQPSCTQPGRQAPAPVRGPGVPAGPVRRP